MAGLDAVIGMWKLLRSELRSIVEIGVLSNFVVVVVTRNNVVLMTRNDVNS